MARARNFLALSDPDPKEMSVVDHLDELRHRLIICILTITLGSIVVAFFVIHVFSILVVPLNPYLNRPGQGHVIITLPSLTAGFTLYLKLAVAEGVVLGLPVLLYQIWMFVAPAVSIHARRYVVPFVVTGITLFLIGGTIGFFIFPRVVGFLVGVGGQFHGTQFILPIDSYVSQFALIVVIFGVVFELPVVLTFLAMIGVTSSRWLRSKRKYAAMIGLISAMVITPGADPFTPFITAAVVYILYEASIISVRLLHR